LQIDTEGYDYEVMKTFDFEEHKHLARKQKKAMLCLLRDNRYAVYNCGGDYFAVNKVPNKALRHIP
jgi:hypothetical protein